MRKYWKSIVHVGVYWEGFCFELCEGPKWWVDFRARLHVFRNPSRCVTVLAPGPRHPLEDKCI